MRTTAKWQAILGLVAVAAMAGTAHAAAGPAAELTFTIHVRNYAGVDGRTLEQAEKATTRIFQKAGVVSRWTDAPVAGEDPYGAADRPVLGLSDIWVSILPASMYGRMNLAAGVTGLAPGEGPDRVLAYIFYNRVEQMEGMQMTAFLRGDIQFRPRLADLLGSAMAHEVGHILLNLAVHSHTGIMCGNWDLGVLTDIANGCLCFTNDQGKAIQAAVTRRAREKGVLAAGSTRDTRGAITLP